MKCEMDMNKKALSLLEIIISTVILALVVTGLVNVFVASKGFIRHSRLRMSAAEMGKKFIDPLQAHVREDEWSTNLFGTNSYANQTSADGNYTASYNITDLDSTIKKVKVTVTWNEPAS